MSIFKACDIRGRYGADLDPTIALAVGRAVGSMLTGKTVVVGGDLRPSTEPLRGALTEGLVAAGCQVIDVGVLPTPAFYFAKDQLNADGGIMVTGSHNPPGDNGFKVSLGKAAITEADIQEIRGRVERADFVTADGSVTRADVGGAYEDFLKRRFPRRAGGARIVVDPGNGCYAQIAPRVLRDCGYDVVELNCEPDGRFPNRSPDPAVAENLKVLAEVVVREKADLGVAYDGDGDRVVFVDQHGRIIESDIAVVLYARPALKDRPGVVVYDIKCSSVVADQVREAGGTPVMEKSGHAFIRGTLLKQNAVLGGEISGHFFFGELGRDDGLYATLLMLDIVHAAGRSLAALSDSVPRYFITPDLRRPCSPEQATTALAALEATFRDDPACEVTTLDGVRVAFADGWALARPSVTEPLLTMRFEARSAARLEELQTLVRELVPSLREIMQ